MRICQRLCFCTPITGKFTRVTRPYHQRLRCNRHGYTSRVWDKLYHRLDVCRVTSNTYNYV
ncbi:hypothetical protein C0J52_17041 [Blattella germanica]|nr:hypothetical protein C0J52_17041 [Blattella germanica]